MRSFEVSHCVLGSDGMVAPQLERNHQKNASQPWYFRKSRPLFSTHTFEFVAKSQGHGFCFLVGFVDDFSSRCCVDILKSRIPTRKRKRRKYLKFEPCRPKSLQCLAWRSFKFLYIDHSSRDTCAVFKRQASYSGLSHHLIVSTASIMARPSSVPSKTSRSNPSSP